MSSRSKNKAAMPPSEPASSPRDDFPDSYHDVAEEVYRLVDKVRKCRDQYDSLQGQLTVLLDAGESAYGSVHMHDPGSRARMAATERLRDSIKHIVQLLQVQREAVKELSKAGVQLTSATATLETEHDSIEEALKQRVKSIEKEIKSLDKEDEKASRKEHRSRSPGRSS